MVIRSCAPLCRLLVPILGIEVWGVGLRWDDDEGMFEMFEEDEGID